MMKLVKAALGIPEAPPPPAARPSVAMVPVPIHRGELIEMRPKETMGFLDRNPDSARPAISPHAKLRTADQEIRIAHRPVAAAARHLLTQSGFLQYGVELNCAWMVGGHGLEPTIIPRADALGWNAAFAKTWARALATRFAEWGDDAASCDAQGRQKFGAMQSAAVRSYLATGDVLATIDYGAKSGTGW